MSLEELASALVKRRYDVLRKYRFKLLIRLLTGPRELTLQRVEDFEIIATKAWTLEVDGVEFLENTTAIEIAAGFISTESAREDEWLEFLERVKEKRHPRIFVGMAFRSRFSIPHNAAEYDVYVLEVTSEEVKGEGESPQ